MAAAIQQSQQLNEIKEDLFRNIRLRMGEGIVDLELDPEHFEAAYKYAVQVYRQRAQNATEEAYTLTVSYTHLTLPTTPYV